MPLNCVPEIALGCIMIGVLATHQTPDAVWSRKNHHWNYISKMIRWSELLILCWTSDAREGVHFYIKKKKGSKLGFFRTNASSIHYCKQNTMLCPCRLGQQTAKHVLKDYSEYCEIRRKYYPNEVTLKYKLYGNRDFSSKQWSGSSWKHIGCVINLRTQHRN